MRGSNLIKYYPPGASIDLINPSFHSWKRRPAKLGGIVCTLRTTNKGISVVIMCVGGRKWEFNKSIFCSGRLLHDVQMMEMFNDPRDFLELKLRRSGDIVAQRYKAIRHKMKIKEPSGRERLKEFVKKNFQNVSTIEPYVPGDWKARFPLLSLVSDSQTKEMLQRANRNWIKFSRKLVKDVEENPNLYSYIPVPNYFFISHLNEKQLAYSESSWLMEALLACDMVPSAKALLENLIHLVSEIGHVPPENRIYFVDRFSPPILPIMLDLYFQKTKDVKFVKKHLHLVELDYLNWFKERSQIVRTPFETLLCVNEERRRLKNPRPEAYLSDMMFKGKSKEEMDFSFVFWDSIPPRSTISVRSTSITERSARILSELSRHFGSYENVLMYQNISTAMLNTMDILLYNSQGAWMDFDPNRGQVGWPSLWPVLSGSRKLKADSILNPITPEEHIVAVRVLLAYGNKEEAKELAYKWIMIHRRQVDTSLIDSCVTILMIQHFPDLQLPPEEQDTIQLHPISALASFLVLIYYLYPSIEKLVLVICS